MKTRQSIRMLPIEQLRAHPGNIRDNLGDLEDLARSIKEHGILQPLVLTEHPTEPDRYLILAGHRRLAAATRAGLTSVPCTIRHGLGNEDTEQLVVMLVENCQRRELGAIEKAEAYGALRNRGLTYGDIARRVGVSVATVGHYLALLELPADDREELRGGSISLADANAMIRADREAARKNKGYGQIGRPKGRKTTPWFGDTHPLARHVRALCDHRGRVKVGNVGCGPCWEQIIRQHANDRAAS